MLIGLIVASAAGLAAWIGAGFWFKRGVEEPSYSVLSNDGDVEVRKYAPQIVATTEVEGDREAALNEGFRRLAGYIFGKNRSKTKIAMTAPVSSTPSEKIAMTAPVAATALEDGKFRITFTMPPSYTMDTLPEPEDERVQLVVQPAQEVAVLRFSGWARGAVVQERTTSLLEWVKRHDRPTLGAPTLAQYDPPFTMPLMRRNEIWVALQ